VDFSITIPSNILTNHIVLFAQNSIEQYSVDLISQSDESEH
jgi:hypothetical protein